MNNAQRFGLDQETHNVKSETTWVCGFRNSVITQVLLSVYSVICRQFLTRAFIFDHCPGTLDNLLAVRNKLYILHDKWYLLLLKKYNELQGNS